MDVPKIDGFVSLSCLFYGVNRKLLEPLSLCFIGLNQFCYLLPLNNSNYGPILGERICCVLTSIGISPLSSSIFMYGFGFLEGPIV